MTKKAYFMGVLSNVDSSILQLQFDHNFTIHDIDEREGRNRISDLERIPPLQAVMKITSDYPCLNQDEKKIYYLSNSFDLDIVTDKETGAMGYSNSFLDFQFLVAKYLDPMFRKIRLFKKGDVRIPLKYCYYFDNGKPFCFSIDTHHRFISNEPFHITESEIPALNRFIRNIDFPFKRSYIQLALVNFDLSYNIPHQALSFLALMVCLESLFNPGRQELRYRISRNAAVLLGENEDDSKRIYEEIRDFYDKRSKIVHTGITDILEDEDIPKMRYYVRESIKKINEINLEKDELLQQLNILGFGDVFTKV